MLPPNRLDRVVLLKHCATGEILFATAVIGNPFYSAGVRSPNSSDVGRRGEYGGIMSYVITASSRCHPQQHLGQAYGQNLLVLGEKYDLIQVNVGTPIIHGGQLPKVVLKTAPSCTRALPQTPNRPMARKGRGLSHNRMSRYKRLRG